jgi:hypothetical protein
MQGLKKFLRISLMIFMAGCAGIGKSCSQFGASNFGGDWIVVQYTFEMKPSHCWKLRDVSLESESGGGINWKDRSDNHLVHVTGWENRVQVQNGNYQSAGRIVGVDANQCENGIYPSHPDTTK